MKNYSLAFVLVLIAVSLSSCDAIAGIFEAGMWSGIIIVIIVVALVIWLFSRFGRK